MKYRFLPFLLVIILAFMYVILSAIYYQEQSYKLIYKDSKGNVIEKTVKRCIVTQSCIECEEITVCGESELMPIYK